MLHDEILIEHVIEHFLARTLQAELAQFVPRNGLTV